MIACRVNENNYCSFSEIKHRQGDPSDENIFGLIAIAMLALSKIFELCIMKPAEIHLVTSLKSLQ